MDTIDKMISWFFERNGKVTYSMDRRLGPNTYDCSSAVYYALWHAGYKTRINWVGNTETLFKEKGHLFEEINRSQIQRGDIFISGYEGMSAGKFGHTGIVYDSNRIIHCNYADNGISITGISNRTGSPVRWFRIKDSGNSKVLKQETNQVVILPKSVKSWRVYPIEGPYQIGSEIGTLEPSKFDGLIYTVDEWLIEGSVASIQTESFGRVAIYIGSDTNAVITNVVSQVANPVHSLNKNNHVHGQAHIQGIGWVRAKKGFFGTIGQSLRLEALAINIKGKPITGIAHIQNVGDVKATGLFGSVDLAYRIEAIKLDIPDNMEYRVHMQDIGWQPWVKTGQWAGIKHQSKRIEAVEFREL